MLLTWSSRNPPGNVHRNAFDVCMLDCLLEARCPGSTTWSRGTATPSAVHLLQICSPETCRRTHTSGWGMFNGAKTHRGFFARAAWRGSDSARGETIEQRFHQQFAGAAGLLDETPLCAKDRYDVLLYCCSAAASPRPLRDTSTPSWREQRPGNVLLRASSRGPGCFLARAGHAPGPSQFFLVVDAWFSFLISS